MKTFRLVLAFFLYSSHFIFQFILLNHSLTLLPSISSTLFESPSFILSFTLSVISLLLSPVTFPLTHISPSLAHIEFYIASYYLPITHLSSSLLLIPFVSHSTHFVLFAHLSFRSLFFFRPFCPVLLWLISPFPSSLISHSRESLNSAFFSLCVSGHSGDAFLWVSHIMPIICENSSLWRRYGGSEKIYPPVNDSVVGRKYRHILRTSK